MKPWRHSRLAYGILGIAIAIYVLATLLRVLPEEENVFHLSQTMLDLLLLTIVVPIVAVWCVALYGSIKFKGYAQVIYKDQDGKALDWIANGLLVLVATLVISSVLQSLEDWLHGNNWATWVIVRNYVTAFGQLGAFYLIYMGTHRLAALVKFKGVHRNKLIVIAGMLPLGFLYAWVVFHNTYRNSTPDPGNIQSYYLSDPLILLTLVLPYVVTWFVGLLAAVNLRSYHKNASGVIYRDALSALSDGLVMVIVSSLVIQLVTALGPALAKLNLAQILGVLYLLIVVYAVGHIRILAGARRLAKLEGL